MSPLPPAYPRPVLVSSPPAPGVPPPQQPPVHARPKTVALKCRALFSLPYRLAHPPPARGQVPSWGITPRFDVSLDDVLDRKHLPPLGLKDFEEWLLFVEQSAENLYFILWLRDYSRRYADWIRSTKLTRSASYAHAPRREYRTPSLPPPASPELTYSYLRAKRTFLTPNGTYELDVPSDVLAPFHVSPSTKTAEGENEGSEQTHVYTAWSGTTCAYGLAYAYALDDSHNAHAPLPPDPAVFAELSELVRDMLRDSLDRFVRATYNNVGTPRAVCGSAGGIVIGLAGSAPLIVNFAVRGARWWRLAALPGMWLGLTIFISAMYGVCMMIYVFGDLRQLRSFELVRPPISAPQPQQHPSPSASAASLFAPRTAPPAPSALAPTLTQLLPFRRTQRRSIPSISSPVPVALAPPMRFAELPMNEKVHSDMGPSPPKLHILTPPSVSSRWPSESVGDSTLRPPPRALTHASRRSGPGERLSSLASVSAADCDTDTDDEGSCAYDSGYEDSADEGAPRIEISDAFYDEHPSPEGPATAAFPGPGLGAGMGAPFWPDYVGSEEEEMTATAAFIHPFAYVEAGRPSAGVGALDVEAQTLRGAAACQPVDPFDFDALPPRRPRFASAGRHRGAQAQVPEGKAGRTGDVMAREKEAKSKGGLGAWARAETFRPRAMLSRWQNRCSPENVVRAHLEREKERAGEKEKAGWGIGWGVASSPLAPSPTVTLAGSPHTPTSFTFPRRTSVSCAEPPSPAKPAPREKMSWHARFRRVQAVPAFAVPLTPVLNPVVTRAQWEIVVRSAAIAFVACALVVGGLTGAPVPRR